MTLLQKSQQKLQNEQLKQTGPLICIVGQTASGKSALAMQLAKHYDGEIVCADSRTMYRKMDIGTAKPSNADRKIVRHHLLDIVDPSERVSAHSFVQLAKKAIKAAWRRNKVPIVVGGSGLYIDALLFDYAFRSTLDTVENDVDSGLDLMQLQAEVRARYRDGVSQEDFRNPRRLAQILKRGLASDQDRHDIKYDCLIIGLEVEAETLRARITARTYQMLEAGLKEEVISIRDEYGEHAPGLQSTGYREMLQSSDEATIAQRINAATWQLARKQRTWFRRNPYIRWCQSEDEAHTLVATYLAQSPLQ
mgnify:CR=1 FL=1